MRLLMLSIILLTVRLAIAAPATNSAAKFAVELTAGSRLIGEPVMRTLPFKTEFTALDIPLTNVTSLTRKDGNPAALLNLRNGDKLTGTLLLKELPLETSLGKLTIPVEQIGKLAILEKPAAEAAPNPEQIAATRDACINNLRIIEAGKDQYALDHNNAAPSSIAELVGPNLYIKNSPACPANGKYNMNPLGINPACSVHGTLP